MSVALIRLCNQAIYSNLNQFPSRQGFRLINETRTSYDSNGVTTTVYTVAGFDPSGTSRPILLGEDQLYPGMCRVLKLRNVLNFNYEMCVEVVI